MNTTTSSKTTRTAYTIVPAMFQLNKFEVKINNSGWLMNLQGDVRVFSSRNGARKAIVRAIRSARGERGALHR